MLEKPYARRWQVLPIALDFSELLVVRSVLRDKQQELAAVNCINEERKIIDALQRKFEKACVEAISLVYH